MAIERTHHQPIAPRERILVAAAHEPERELRLAEAYGTGVEIQYFSFPQTLAGDFEPALSQLAERLNDFPGRIGAHGAFIDTCHFSADPEVRRVARMRYIQSLDIAERLGARYVVFHSQYNPVIKVAAYPQIYLDGSLEFWPPMIEEASRRGIVLYMENMFDHSPEPLRRLMERLHGPYFRVCIDIAHVAVFSSLDFSGWIDELQPYLAHVHMNDCDGELDDHLGLGRGKLDLPQAFQLLRAANSELTYTLETSRDTDASMAYIGLEPL